jgi:ribosome-associated protein
MGKVKKVTSSVDELVNAVVDGMNEKKGSDIAVMDMRKLKSAPTDFFIICHADSDRQVEAIARSIDEVVKKKVHEDAWHTEGLENCEWVLLDYINVVAHVFVREKRDFYGIEELWGDADIEMK